MPILELFHLLLILLIFLHAAVIVLQVFLPLMAP